MNEFSRSTQPSNAMASPQLQGQKYNILNSRKSSTANSNNRLANNEYVASIRAKFMGKVKLSGQLMND